MTPWRPGPLSECGALEEVVVAPARHAFVDRARVSREWRSLNFTAEPDLDLAFREYDAFLDVLQATGATIRTLDPSPLVTMDAIYARDASVLVPDGIVLCAMGKPARAGEPVAQGLAFERWGLPVVGRIEPPGRLEGGDLLWLDPGTVAVGEGYRTNAHGIAQFASFLPASVECLRVPLVHWRGPADVFHLMSLVSPVDRDLLVVYSPLLPVPFRDRLLAMGYALVEVDADEFESMGTNVLALGPRRVLMLDGNPVTRRRLEAAGAEVLVYAGSEISVKGGGGPTCLTRPLRRRAIASGR